MNISHQEFTNEQLEAVATLAYRSLYVGDIIDQINREIIVGHLTGKSYITYEVLYMEGKVLPKGAGEDRPIQLVIKKVIDKLNSRGFNTSSKPGIGCRTSVIASTVSVDLNYYLVEVRIDGK